MATSNAAGEAPPTSPRNAGVPPASSAAEASPATSPETAPSDKPRSSHTLDYRPEIDGLRAFAVIPVILYHLAIPGLAAGNLGVDVFFVISGFLITSIVKREADTGRFSFRKFWGRRIRRILPAMIALTAASLLFAFFFVYRPDQPPIGRQASWALFSGANIYFWKWIGNYWGLAASQSPFLHTWSLSVEEQFYLFFPPAIWLIYKFCPRRLFVILLFGAAASLGLFLFEVPRHPEAAFYLLPMRAWELAAGCALAAVRIPRATRATALLAVLGLAIVLASYALLPALGVGMIAATLGSLLVIAFGRAGPAFRILANPLPVAIGKLSYSLYLWHWPVIVFPAYMDRHLPLWGSLPLMTLLALLSYFLVEKPTRRAKGIIPYILAAFALTAAGALLLANSHRRHDISAFDRPKLWLSYYDSNPHGADVGPDWADFDVPTKPLDPGAYLNGGIRIGTGDPQIVLLGDSCGAMWSPIVRSITDDLHLPASFWIINGVTPFFTVPPTRQQIPSRLSDEEKSAYDLARIHLLTQWKPKMIIVCAHWADHDAAQVRPFLDFLAHAAPRVLLIEQPPELPFGPRNALQYLRYKGYLPQPGVTQYYPMGETDAVAKGRDLLRILAAEHPNCQIIPTYDLFAAGPNTRVLDGRQATYVDFDHLTEYGASLARPRIAQALADALHP